jgi:lysozyme
MDWMTVMMTPEMTAKLRRSLILHEGYHKFIYVDTMGKLTGGIGYNFSDRGLSEEWIQDQYNKDVNYFYNQLSTFPWFHELNEDRQIILIDMSFMGWKKFLSFKRMIAALQAKDYQKAGLEMLDSRWAKQVGQRAVLLANAMIKGVYQI